MCQPRLARLEQMVSTENIHSFMRCIQIYEEFKLYEPIFASGINSILRHIYFIVYLHWFKFDHILLQLRVCTQDKSSKYALNQTIRINQSEKARTGIEGSMEKVDIKRIIHTNMQNSNICHPPTSILPHTPFNTYSNPFALLCPDPFNNCEQEFSNG